MSRWWVIYGDSLRMLPGFAYIIEYLLQDQSVEQQLATLNILDISFADILHT